MNGRRYCPVCKNPIMIVDSKPVSPIGTSDVVQVTKFGCLNKDCDMYKVIVDTKEQPYI